jgi:3-hydroxyacyl-CoA dehydrogenase
MNLMVEEGALPEQVDKVMVDFGYPIGPFATPDLSGLDIGYDSRQRRGAARPDRGQWHHSDAQLFDMTKFGRGRHMGRALLHREHVAGDPREAAADEMISLRAAYVRSSGMAAFGASPSLPRAPVKVSSASFCRPSSSYTANGGLRLRPRQAA